jgi:2-oxoglutarate/2-oxoacid ferredoxin oxidoreductase subunit beta
VALGAEATFVARSIDTDAQHLVRTLDRAAKHRGASFVEVYQNCNIFNDGAFAEFAAKEVRADRTLVLEHGKPMIFGKERDKGIRLNGLRPEVVQLGDGVSKDDLLVHDETREDPTIAFMLSRMEWPEYPVPVGVLRAVERPTYDELMSQQIDQAVRSEGEGDIQKLFLEGDTWTVE